MFWNSFQSQIILKETKPWFRRFHPCRLAALHRWMRILRFHEAYLRKEAEEQLRSKLSVCFFSHHVFLVFFKDFMILYAFCFCFFCSHHVFLVFLFWFYAFCLFFLFAPWRLIRDDDVFCVCICLCCFRSFDSVPSSFATNGFQRCCSNFWGHDVGVACICFEHYIDLLA